MSEEEAIGISEAESFANEINAILMQTSAKEGTGVIKLFEKVAERVYLASKANSQDLFS